MEWKRSEREDIDFKAKHLIKYVWLLIVRDIQSRVLSNKVLKVLESKVKKWYIYPINFYYHPIWSLFFILKSSTFYQFPLICYFSIDRLIQYGWTLYISFESCFSWFDEDFSSLFEMKGFYIFTLQSILIFLNTMFIFLYKLCLFAYTCLSKS